MCFVVVTVRRMFICQSMYISSILKYKSMIELRYSLVIQVQHLNKVLCGVLVLILCVPLFAQYSAGENQDVQMYTGTKSTTSRTVLAECFTGTWCQYCPAAEGALNRLANEMNRSQLAIIEWHYADGYSDPYEPPDGSAGATSEISMEFLAFPQHSLTG
jgi:thiol-disulfide isomerase/thioredoxin